MAEIPEDSLDAAKAEQLRMWHELQESLKDPGESLSHGSNVVEIALAASSAISAVVPIVTAKITKSTAIRVAEIEAEIERLKIAAEMHGGTGTLREAPRVQTTPPAVPPAPPTV